MTEDNTFVVGGGDENLFGSLRQSSLPPTRQDNTTLLSDDFGDANEAEELLAEDGTLLRPHHPKLDEIHTSQQRFSCWAVLLGVLVGLLLVVMVVVLVLIWNEVVANKSEIEDLQDSTDALNASIPTSEALDLKPQLDELTELANNITDQVNVPTSEIHELLVSINTTLPCTDGADGNSHLGGIILYDNVGENYTIKTNVSDRVLVTIDSGGSTVFSGNVTASQCFFLDAERFACRGETDTRVYDTRGSLQLYSNNTLALTFDASQDAVFIGDVGLGDSKSVVMDGVDVLTSTASDVALTSAGLVIVAGDSGVELWHGRTLITNKLVVGPTDVTVTSDFKIGVGKSYYISADVVLTHNLFSGIQLRAPAGDDLSMYSDGTLALTFDSVQDAIFVSDVVLAENNSIVVNGQDVLSALAGETTISSSGVVALTLKTDQDALFAANVMLADTQSVMINNQSVLSASGGVTTISSSGVAAVTIDATQDVLLANDLEMVVGAALVVDGVDAITTSGSGGNLAVHIQSTGLSGQIEFVTPSGTSYFAGTGDLYLIENLIFGDPSGASITFIGNEAIAYTSLFLRFTHPDEILFYSGSVLALTLEADQDALFAADVVLADTKSVVMDGVDVLTSITSNVALKSVGTVLVAGDSGVTLQYGAFGLISNSLVVGIADVTVASDFKVASLKSYFIGTDEVLTQNGTMTVVMSPDAIELSANGSVVRVEVDGALVLPAGIEMLDGEILWVDSVDVLQATSGVTTQLKSASGTVTLVANGNTLTLEDDGDLDLPADLLVPAASSVRFGGLGDGEGVRFGVSTCDGGLYEDTTRPAMVLNPGPGRHMTVLVDPTDSDDSTLFEIRANGCDSSDGTQLLSIDQSGNLTLHTGSFIIKGDTHAIGENWTVVATTDYDHQHNGLSRFTIHTNGDATVQHDLLLLDGNSIVMDGIDVLTSATSNVALKSVGNVLVAGDTGVSLQYGAFGLISNSLVVGIADVIVASDFKVASGKSYFISTDVVLTHNALSGIQLRAPIGKDLSMYSDNTLALTFDSAQDATFAANVIPAENVMLSDTQSIMINNQSVLSASGGVTTISSSGVTAVTIDATQDVLLANDLEMVVGAALVVDGVDAITTSGSGGNLVVHIQSTGLSGQIEFITPSGTSYFAGTGDLDLAGELVFDNPSGSAIRFIGFQALSYTSTRVLFGHPTTVEFETGASTALALDVNQDATFGGDIIVADTQSVVMDGVDVLTSASSAVNLESSAQVIIAGDTGVELRYGRTVITTTLEVGASDVSVNSDFAIGATKSFYIGAIHVLTHNLFSGVQLRAPVGEDLSMYSNDTLALTFDASQDATFTGNVVLSGLVDGVDLGAFKADYDSKIDQALLTTSNPTFNSIVVTTTVDGVDLGAFKIDYDSKIDQAVLTTSSPEFAGLSIGTDTPLAPLHIENGGAWISSSGNGRVCMLCSGSSLGSIIELLGNPSASTQGAIWFTDGNTGSIKGRIRYEYNTNSMAFYTNAINQMHIDSSGNVGIGHVDQMVSLDVNGAVVARGPADNYNSEQVMMRFMRFDRGSFGTADRHHYITAKTLVTDGDENYIGFHIDDGTTTDGTSHTEALRLTADTAVMDVNLAIGVAVAAAGVRLHVDGGRLRVDSGDAGSGVLELIGNTGVISYIFVETGTSDLVLQTKFSNDVRIDASGGTIVLEDDTHVETKLGVGAAPLSYASIRMHGTAASAADGPHFAATVSTDVYPVFSQLNWAHDNIQMHFDAYYDGSTRSSDAGSNFAIRKIGDRLSIAHAAGVNPGVSITWATALSLAASTGDISIISSLGVSRGLNTPHGKLDLQLGDGTSTEKVVFQGYGSTAQNAVLLGKYPSFTIFSGESNNANNPASVSLVTTNIDVAGQAQAGFWFGTTRSSSAELSADTYTIVADGDVLGKISWFGDDGTDMRTTAASIHAYVDGTPASNNIPATIEYWANTKHNFLGLVVFNDGTDYANPSTAPVVTLEDYSEETFAWTTAGSLAVEQTVNAKFVRVGDSVTFHWDAFSDTCNSAGQIYISGTGEVPSYFRPRYDVYHTQPLRSGGTWQMGYLFVSTAGEVIWFADAASTNFPASGTCTIRGSAVVWTV